MILRSRLADCFSGSDGVDAFESVSRLRLINLLSVGVWASTLRRQVSVLGAGGSPRRIDKPCGVTRGSLAELYRANVCRHFRDCLGTARPNWARCSAVGNGARLSSISARSAHAATRSIPGIVSQQATAYDRSGLGRAISSRRSSSNAISCSTNCI